jgi:predicted XRE-type DNA-binding protein
MRASTVISVELGNSPRAQIGIHEFRTIKDRKLKRRQIAEILGITQRDVSHLMNGHLSCFTGDGKS